MDHSRRLLLVILLLAVLGPGHAQPSFPAPGEATPAPAPSTNAAAAIRQRFMRRTNELAGNTNLAQPAQSFPVPPSGPARRFNAGPDQPVNVDANAPVTVATPSATTVTQPNTNQPNPNVVAQPTFPAPPGIQPQPVVAAPAGATPQPIPGTTRTAIPIPTPGAPPAQTPPGMAAAAPTAAGETPSPVNPALDPNEQIPAGTIALQGLAIDQFFDIYSLYSGRTILRPYALPAPQGLTLKSQTDLSRLEVVEAMDGVLALNNITMIPIGGKFVKAVPSNMADKEGAPISTNDVQGLPMAEQFLTRVVKLKTAKPSEIAPHLQGLAKTPTAVTPIDSNQTLILRDYASNIRRMLDIVEKIDVTPESDFTLEVLPIKYGKVGDIYSTMSALISGGGTGAPTGSTTSGAAGLSRPVGQFPGSNRGIGGTMGNRYGSGGYNPYGGSSYGNRYGGTGGYNYGGYNPMEMEHQVVPQQVAPGASPGAAQGSFQQRLNQIVNKAAGQDQVKILENAQIVPDERSNKLLIFSNKRDMSMITNIVAKLDVMLAQVLIEAIILEVKLGDSLKVGVSATQAPTRFGDNASGAGAISNGQIFQGLTNFPSGVPEGFTYFTKVSDFNVAINAIAKDNSINIVSRPRIQTSHAIPGSFFIGETVPYVTGVYDYGAGYGGAYGTRSQIQQQEIGLTLDVVPFITPEGMVVMEITENFQQRTGDVIIDGNPIPLVNTRAATAVLTARSGDIIMLGGFITESRSKSKSGVPFLKDIPGLGVLFRTSNNENQRGELILLMRATVLDTPEAAAFMAETERLQLPGVRQAEREFDESDTKRLKKVEQKTKKK